MGREQNIKDENICIQPDLNLYPMPPSALDYWATLTEMFKCASTVSLHTIRMKTRVTIQYHWYR